MMTVMPQDIMIKFHKYHNLVYREIMDKVFELFKKIKKKAYYHIEGTSMLPCIKENEKVELIWMYSKYIKKNDVIVFMSEKRLYVHRVLLKYSIFNKIFFIERGDNDFLYTLVLEDRVLGKITMKEETKYVLWVPFFTNRGSMKIIFFVLFFLLFFPFLIITLLFCLKPDIRKKIEFFVLQVFPTLVFNLLALFFLRNSGVKMKEILKALNRKYKLDDDVLMEN